VSNDNVTIAGESTSITVTTSSEVAYLYANNTRVTDYVDHEDGTRTWTIALPTDTAQTMEVEIVGADKNNVYTESVTTTVTVEEPEVEDDTTTDDKEETDKEPDSDEGNSDGGADAPNKDNQEDDKANQVDKDDPVDKEDHVDKDDQVDKDDEIVEDNEVDEDEDMTDDSEEEDSSLDSEETENKGKRSFWDWIKELIQAILDWFKSLFEKVMKE
jgi:hypothetical protein